MTTPLIIDTDVALGVWHDGRPRDIDDGFAIVEAINNPAIDLLGVTTVYGNGPLHDVHRVAEEIVHLKQADIPVHQGAQGPLSEHRDSNAAVAYLADVLSQRRCAIAAIGPLTNIALLIQHHPDVIHNIDSLVMVAGRSIGREFFIGDIGPVGDFNFENDIAAAEIVMAANLPCVLMGFELTSQVCVTRADLEQIRRRDNPTASYFYTNSLAWCDYWTATFPSDSGFHPWDSAAIAWFVNPTWFATSTRGYRIAHEPKRFDCDAALPGPKHQYCSGFTPGGKAAFVQSVVEHVY